MFNGFIVPAYLIVCAKNASDAYQAAQLLLDCGMHYGNDDASIVHCHVHDAQPHAKRGATITREEYLEPGRRLVLTALDAHASTVFGVHDKIEPQSGELSSLLAAIDGQLARYASKLAGVPTYATVKLEM